MWLKLIPFLAFALIASPSMFKLVRGILGNWVASADGLPTQMGVALHALVFVLVVHFIMKMTHPRRTRKSTSVSPNVHPSCDQLDPTKPFLCPPGSTYEDTCQPSEVSCYDMYPQTSNYRMPY